MGVCTKVKWTNPEGKSVDTLFCHGIMPVDTYYEYLKDYSRILRRGDKPTVAVGFLAEDGSIGYRFTDKPEHLSNADTYVLGACPNYSPPTWQEIEDMFRRRDNWRIERARRIRRSKVSMGEIPFDSGEDALDYLIGRMED